MHNVMIPTKEKGRASRAPAGALLRQQAYAPVRTVSRAFSRKCFPARDRRPPQAPSNTGLSLLHLQEHASPRRQWGRSWERVESHIRQIVEARHGQGEAA